MLFAESPSIDLYETVTSEPLRTRRENIFVSFVLLSVMILNAIYKSVSCREGLRSGLEIIANNLLFLTLI